MRKQNKNFFDVDNFGDNFVRLKKVSINNEHNKN